MRRIDYTLTQDGDPFCIVSYNTAVPANTLRQEIDQAPALIITNISGQYFSGLPADVLGCVILPDNATPLAAALHQNPQDFFNGQCETWKLTQVDVEAGELRLEYHNPINGDSDQIELSINDSRLRGLELTIEVPHLDQRPNTVYHLSLEQLQMSSDQPRRSRTIITEILPYFHQRNLFMLSSEHPGEISATSYVDL